MSKNTPKLVRKSPPVICSGFRFGSGDELAILDFIDAQDEGNSYIINSVALTKKQAKSLAEQLAKFSEEKEE